MNLCYSFNELNICKFERHFILTHSIELLPQQGMFVWLFCVVVSGQLYKLEVINTSSGFRTGQTADSYILNIYSNLSSGEWGILPL